jgi:Arc/MetJ-type ribon-helix-helix transcriptional regulator
LDTTRGDKGWLYHDVIMWYHDVVVRTQIQLTEEQHRALRELARKQQTSMSELVRRAIDAMLGATSASDEAAAQQRALAVIGRFHGGTDDAAERHDAYLVDAFES